MDKKTSQFPSWVRGVLENIRVTIYRAKTDQILKNKVPLLDLPHKLLASDISKERKHVFVIGFEDEENIWNERCDVNVKVYELKNKTYRVEIFCSGVNKKEVYYKGNLVLRYEGYSEDDIREKKSIPATVIFDTEL